MLSTLNCNLDKEPHCEADDCAHQDENEKTKCDFFENTLFVSFLVLAIESIGIARNCADVVRSALLQHNDDYNRDASKNHQD